MVDSHQRRVQHRPQTMQSFKWRAGFVNGVFISFSHLVLWSDWLLYRYIDRHVPQTQCTRTTTHATKTTSAQSVHNTTHYATSAYVAVCVSFAWITLAFANKRIQSCSLQIKQFECKTTRVAMCKRICYCRWRRRCDALALMLRHIVLRMNFISWCHCDSLIRASYFKHIVAGEAFSTPG